MKTTIYVDIYIYTLIKDPDGVKQSNVVYIRTNAVKLNTWSYRRHFGCFDAQSRANGRKNTWTETNRKNE